MRSKSSRTAVFYGFLLFGFVGCQGNSQTMLEEASKGAATSSQSKSTSTDNQPKEPLTGGSPDIKFGLFEPVGEIRDEQLRILCYGFSRTPSKDDILNEAKELVKTLKPGREVAYIFNRTKGIDDFLTARANGREFTPQLSKWMKESHFATIAFMDGNRWELNQNNDVAFRKFNNKGESIPLSGEQ